MYDEYRHLARRAVLVHLQVLRAIVETADAEFAADAGPVLGRIFHDNAAATFG